MQIKYLTIKLFMVHIKMNKYNKNGQTQTKLPNAGLNTFQLTNGRPV